MISQFYEAETYDSCELALRRTEFTEEMIQEIDGEADELAAANFETLKTLEGREEVPEDIKATLFMIQKLKIILSKQKTNKKPKVGKRKQPEANQNNGSNDNRDENLRNNIENVTIDYENRRGGRGNFSGGRGGSRFISYNEGGGFNRNRRGKGQSFRGNSDWRSRTPPISRRGDRQYHDYFQTVRE